MGTWYLITDIPESFKIYFSKPLINMKEHLIFGRRALHSQSFDVTWNLHAK